MSAVAMLPILAAAGSAVDLVRKNNVETELMAALDGAVLAGAASSTNKIANAELFFDAAFKIDDVTSFKRSFKLESGSFITGTASAVLRPGMMATFGLGDIQVSEAAKATYGATTTASSSASNGGVCVLALAPNTSQAMLVNSGADVKATDCEIHVKSVANPAAIFNAGSSINSKKICIKGTSYIDNGGYHPNLESGCTIIPDPYAGKVKVPAPVNCNFSNGNYSGATVLSPGVYCGWHNFNSGSSVTLNPGLYVLKDGGWNVNGGTWTGTGVTFYYYDTSKIQFNSAVAATLKAPTSGDYNGFLFVEKSGLSDSQFIFDDNKGFDMEGIIYLPSREVVFNSNTTMRSKKMTAVMRTVIFNNVNWTISNYDPTGTGGSAAAVAGVDIRLVE